ncbi:MAG: methyltransferase domain-containing protein [Nocardioidaceae bacterium]
MPDDVYTHGHADAVLRSHRWRTAENSAAYLLPQLASDAVVLDVGCGPGTITVDLATRVPRGRVVGIDRSAEVVAEAALHEVPNARFEVGDVYALSYADASFDVVHAHQVLQHLSDPVAALRELRRVCRPGGLVAARDSDYGAFTWWPEYDALDDWLTLYQAVARGNRGEPDAGRRIKSWAIAAGCTDVTATASVWGFSSPDERAWWAGLWADRVTASALAEQAVARGLATPADLARIADGWRAWAASADGWFSVLHGEIVCRR